MTKNSRQEIKELKQEILELQCITSRLSKIVFRLEEELDKEERVAEVVSIPEAVPVRQNKVPANSYIAKQNESDGMSKHFLHSKIAKVSGTNGAVNFFLKIVRLSSSSK